MCFVKFHTVKILKIVLQIRGKTPIQAIRGDYSHASQDDILSHFIYLLCFWSFVTGYSSECLFTLWAIGLPFWLIWFLVLRYKNNQHKFHHRLTAHLLRQVLGHYGCQSCEPKKLKWKEKSQTHFGYCLCLQWCFATYILKQPEYSC